MKFKYEIILKCVVWLIMTAVIVIFATMTNAGLQTTLGIAAKFVPGKIRFGKIEGTWVSNALIHDTSYELNHNKLKIKELEVNLKHKCINVLEISGLEHFWPQALYDTTSITQMHFIVSYQQHDKTWLANLNAQGLWNKQPSKANITISSDSLIAPLESNKFMLHNLVINVANNLIALKKQNNEIYTFNAQIKNIKNLYKEASGDLHLKGSIKNGAKLDLKLNSKEISYEHFQWHNINLDLNTDINDHLHPLHSNLTIKKIHFFDDKIHNFSLKVDGNLLAHTIKSHCNFLENDISYTIKGKFKDKIWEAHGDDPDNHIDLKFNFNKAQHLDGIIKLSLTDFSQIGEFLPKVSRVKAKLKANFIFKGTFDEPKIVAHSEITEITATIPSMGVKIKPMSIILDIDDKHKLTVDVHGKMRKGVGEFTLTGYMYLNDPNFKNSFQLNGKEVEFIKTKKKHLIANADLHLHYDHAQNNLNVDGNIEILSGFMHFDDHKTITKTQDIVFTDERVNKNNKNINIIPHIYLRIEEPLPVKGFNLDGEITGKLLITYDNNNLYGLGRITIKKGTYTIPGKKLTIDRGRVIYPEGTLLTNPLLDIKAIKLKSIDKNVIDAGIFVNGTARNPIISEVGMTGGTDQTISQALMAGSSIIPNEFAAILNISDIGIVNNNNQTSDFFAEQLYDDNTRDKSFFIGRQFGDRTYLQYQRNLQDEADTVNFKYALSDNWSIGFDAGTKDKGNGTELGTDLSFSMEKD